MKSYYDIMVPLAKGRAVVNNLHVRSKVFTLARSVVFTLGQRFALYLVTLNVLDMFG